MQVLDHVPCGVGPEREREVKPRVALDRVADLRLLALSVHHLGDRDCGAAKERWGDRDNLNPWFFIFVWFLLSPGMVTVGEI